MKNKPKKIPSICRRLLLHNFILLIIFPVLIILLSILWLQFRLRIDLPTINKIEMRPLLLKVLAYSYLPPILGLLIMGGLAFILVNRLIHPEKSKLGKAILAQTKELEIINVNQLFDEIDKDIFYYGKNFNGIFVGKDWIIGRCGEFSTTAFQKKNIRAIFQKHDQYFHKNFYHLCLFDQNDKKVEFNLSLSKELDAIYTYLCGEYQLAKHGWIREYYDFRSLSREKRNEFYDNYSRKLAEEENEDQDSIEKHKIFMLTGSFFKPCSCTSFYKVEETLDKLVHNENFQLTPMIPLYHRNGVFSVGISCTPSGSDLYEVKLLIDEAGVTMAFSKVCSKMQTRQLFSSYFYYREIPKIYDWTPIGPYKPKQDSQNRPPVTITVDVDELIK